MIERNSRLVRELERILRRELALQQEYSELLTQERLHLTKFNSDKIVELSSKREEVSEQMRIASEERLELMKLFPEHHGKRLTELVARHCHPEDVVLLLPLAEKLRAALKHTKSLGTEFRQLADFSLNLVNGALSILWSATQNVTRSYTPQGTLQEKYHHTAGQTWAGLLKRA